MRQVVSDDIVTLASSAYAPCSAFLLSAFTRRNQHRAVVRLRLKALYPLLAAFHPDDDRLDVFSRFIIENNSSLCDFFHRHVRDYRITRFDHLEFAIWQLYHRFGILGGYLEKLHLVERSSLSNRDACRQNEKQDCLNMFLH